MRTLVILPTYNEKENLATVVKAILDLPLPAASELAVLVVDDASPDGTGQSADELSATNPSRVFTLHRPAKLGLGSAYLDGFRFALKNNFDAACEMDADGQHEPTALPNLIAAVSAGADVAIGSRRVAGGRTEGWGPHRDLMSRSAMTLTRWALGLKTRDVTAGFRCYRAVALQRLLEAGLRSDGYAFQEEALFWCERFGLRIKEVPIVFRARRHGASKLDWAEIRKFFATVRRLRRAARQQRH